MNYIKELQEFLNDHSDGDREHSEGIKIHTVDNPGWSISISIRQTSFQGKQLDTVDIERSESDWIYCKLEDDVFHGVGGVFNLEEILSLFFYWINN